MKLIDILQNQAEAMRQADSIIAKATAEGRELTASETAAYDIAMSRHTHLDSLADERQATMTLRSVLGGKFPLLALGGGAPVRNGQKPMSAEYNEAFLALLRSGGQQTSSALSEGFDPLFGGFQLPSMAGMSAASYEGASGSSTTAGGYAVSVPTDHQITPLAVVDLGVRSLAKVIPTATDIKIPGQATFATAGIKLESGSSANLFTESEPTLNQILLTSYMMGLYAAASFELLQDSPAFQEFLVQDLLDAINIKEDSFFVSGSGSGQPQGLIGNVGTGTAAPYAVESTLAYLLDSTIDVVGTLKGAYYKNASWLMSRATATAIHRAQIQANLFAPVWTREGGRDFLHGFPVTYSQAMPALPTATTAGVTPILFGSFQDGYVIGDRGGAGTFVKILDQPNALAGQVVFMGYKRTDGRVRQPEAIQQISISHT